jgi:hypothetical protein
VPLAAADTLLMHSWPDAVETVGLLGWRVMIGGLVTLALVCLTLIVLDLSGAMRCIPDAVMERASRSGRFWPRVIGFVVAATLVWSGYNAFLFAS